MIAQAKVVQGGATGRAPSRTGLPDRLKAGVERLSGVAMDDVQVHYNSSKPAGIGALAYTQGTDIHVGPGQERHLPHEAWHVVQQEQGRVRATLQMRGFGINDDQGLEREADEMGAEATSKQVGAARVRRAARGAVQNANRAIQLLTNKKLETPDTIYSTLKPTVAKSKLYNASPYKTSIERLPDEPTIRARAVEAVVNKSTTRDDTNRTSSQLKLETSTFNTRANTINAAWKFERLLLTGSLNGEEKYSTGHLIADELIANEGTEGGTKSKMDQYELWNLAPQISGANRNFTPFFEKMIRAAADEQQARIKLQATVKYGEPYKLNGQQIADRLKIEKDSAVRSQLENADGDFSFERRIPYSWKVAAEIIEGEPGVIAAHKSDKRSTDLKNGRRTGRTNAYDMNVRRFEKGHALATFNWGGNRNRKIKLRQITPSIASSSGEQALSERQIAPISAPGGSRVASSLGRQTEPAFGPADAGATAMKAKYFGVSKRLYSMFRFALKQNLLSSDDIETYDKARERAEELIANDQYPEAAEWLSAFCKWLEKNVKERLEVRPPASTVSASSGKKAIKEQQQHLDEDSDQENEQEEEEEIMSSPFSVSKEKVDDAAERDVKEKEAEAKEQQEAQDRQREQYRQQQEAELREPGAPETSRKRKLVSQTPGGQVPGGSSDSRENQVAMSWSNSPAFPLAGQPQGLSGSSAASALVSLQPLHEEDDPEPNRLSTLWSAWATRHPELANKKTLGSKGTWNFTRHK
jgi:hypothetical protein